MSLMTSSPTQRRCHFLRLGASLTLVLGATLLTSSLSVAQENPPLDIATSTSKQALFQELQEGGLVIYFRHGRTNKGGVDRIDWPRHEQRLLSEAGVEQSERIGRAFKKYQFAVGEVLSSPFARCHDMAMIAFGRTEDKMDLLGLLSKGEERAQRVAYSHTLVAQAVPAEQNRIIVGHSSNISESTGRSIAEGDAVVLRPHPQGPEVLAVLSPEDWERLAD